MSRNVFATRQRTEVYTCLANSIDRELYQAIEYLREQVQMLVERQEKLDERIRLNNSRRMRLAARAKRLSQKVLEQYTELFTPDPTSDGIENSVLKNTMGFRIARLGSLLKSYHKLAA